MEWSFVRKLKVIGILGVVFVALFFLLFWRVLFPTPTCFDGRRNGDELGRDCGGTCALYCPFQTLPLRTKSAQSYPIATGFVHSVAYLEQPNPNAVLDFFQYEFRLYNEIGEELARREGTYSSLNHAGSFALAEALIEVSEVPAYTTFSIIRQGNWQSIDSSEFSPQFEITHRQPQLFQFGTRIEGTISTQKGKTYTNARGLVLVYGNQESVQAVFPFVVPRLSGEETTPFVATWPFRFREPVSRIEVQVISNHSL